MLFIYMIIMWELDRTKLEQVVHLSLNVKPHMQMDFPKIYIIM